MPNINIISHSSQRFKPWAFWPKNCKVPVDLVVNTARRALYTGHIGDGKIFVYDVRDALKVRTGETGVAALQAVDDIEDVG